MPVTFRRLLMYVGLVMFVVAALIGFGEIGKATVSDVLATIAVGLACWIAATIP